MSTLTLIIKQPNVIQVFDFRETPEPMIIMAYHNQGNIIDAGIANDDKYVSAFGQVLDGLGHLHAKGLVHRDLKPENFLVETDPFKIVIADFGMAKVATDTTLLTTFCGSPMYIAPEVFPGLSNGYGPLADVWSLGVIVLKWLYDIPDPPDVPEPTKNKESVLCKDWLPWVKRWAFQLLKKLDDQDEDKLVNILGHMLELKVSKRWPAGKCLTQGCKSGLFKRRLEDGLVVNASDPDEHNLSTEEGDDKSKTPTATSLQSHLLG